MEGGALAKHQASEDQRKLLAAPAHRWEPRFPFFFFSLIKDISYLKSPRL